MAPFKLGAPAELHFSYAGLEDPSLPDDALQLLMLGARDGVWVEVPATFDRATKTCTATVWHEGEYAIVANAGLLPLPPATSVLGSAGGRVRYGRLTLEFPPGCFAEDVRITVGPPHPRVSPWRGGLPFHFDVAAVRVRDGQAVHQLGAPLRMRVGYHEAELGRQPIDLLHFAYFNETTGWWEALPSTVDRLAREVVAETTHLSTYGATTWSIDEPFDFGTSWPRVDAFTGNVGMGVPFELPPGPGGLGPDLKLTYSSQGSHAAQRGDRLSNANGGKGQQSASWVGEGFDLPIGAVALTTDFGSNEHFTLSVWGQGFRIKHDGMKWRARDEHFWKIDRDGTDLTVGVPGTGVRYAWRAISPDGTKYFFGVHKTPDNESDIQVYYDFNANGQRPQRWMLSRVEDTHGNVVLIDWARLTKNVTIPGKSGTMTPAVYPTQIRYGGKDPAIAGNPALPHAIVFNRSGTPVTTIYGTTGVDRADVGSAWTDLNGCQTTFDIKYLDSVDVLVNGSLARRYKFTVNTGSIPLMLNKVEVWSDSAGSNKQLVLAPTYCDPPFWDADRKRNSSAEAAQPYRLVTQLANAFGGAWRFEYEFAEAVQYEDYQGTAHAIYEGRVARATKFTADPGFGGAQVVTTYTGYLTPTGNNDATWPEFWGHSQVTAKEMDGATVLSQTVSSFHQSWPRVGRPTQVDVKDGAGYVLRSIVSTWSWTTDLTGWGNAIGWDWVHLDQLDVTQGTGQKRTTFEYDTTRQDGRQLGNQTDVREYDLVVSATNFVRHTRRWFWPALSADRHIVNRVGAEDLYRNAATSPGGANADGGYWDAVTWFLYDSCTRQDRPIGTSLDGGDGSYRGRLTRVRRAMIVDGATKMVDTAYGYDAWGNRTSESAFNSYGDFSNLATADERRTETTLDPTYHAFASAVKIAAQDASLALLTQYDYDYVKGRLTKVTDPNGQETWHAYDPLGRRTETWLPGDDHNQPGAATITYRYLVGGSAPTRVQIGRRKDAGGGTFGARGYEWRFFDGLGRLIQTQRDHDRRIARVRAIDVNEIWAALSARGQPPGFAQVVAGQDRISASHWNGLRDKIGVLWNAPAFGQAVPAWSSGSAPTGAPNPRPIYLSDLTDLRTWLNADEQSRGLPLTGWTQLAAKVAVVNRTYDARGLLQRETVPHELTLGVPGQFQAADWSSGSTPATTYTYETLRRPSTRTRPGNEQESWTYSGWTTTHRNARGLATDSTADALGRLVRVAQMYANNTPAAVVDYRYDAADRLRLVLDGTCHDAAGNLNVTARGGAGNVTEVAYDQLGRKTDLWDPDLGHWTYRYNAVGTLSRQTDARGCAIDFVYDALGRLRFKSDGNLAEVLAELRYDEPATGYFQKGRRTTSVWGSGQTEQTKSYYDNRGRCVRADHTLGGQAYSVQTAFDELDRVLAVAYPNGETVQYAYGDHGLPIALQSSRWGWLVTNATYNALLQPYDVALGNGLVSTRRYFGLDYNPPSPRNPLERYGMLRSIAGGAAQNLTYDFDPNGNVSSLVDARNQGEALAFTYDHADRLWSAASALLSESYGYDDKAGKMTAKNGVARSFPSAGAAHPHAPDAVGGQGYSYDANGNLTTAEGRTYTYDVENRLAQILLGGTQRKVFGYDADGALRWRADGAGPVRRYVARDYQVDVATGQPVVYYRFGGRTVARATAAGLRFVLTDHLGTPHAEVAADRAELAQRRTTPFGSDRAVAGANDLSDEERFTGQPRVDDGGGNANAEFYHFGARAYLPGVALFAQPDSLVPDPTNPEALNRYVYAYNNPLKYTDPTGHDPWWKPPPPPVEEGGEEGGGEEGGGDGEGGGEPTGSGPSGPVESTGGTPTGEPGDDGDGSAGPPTVSGGGEPETAAGVTGGGSETPGPAGGGSDEPSPPVVAPPVIWTGGAGVLFGLGQARQPQRAQIGRLAVQFQVGSIHIDSIPLADATGQGVSVDATITALEVMYAKPGNVKSGMNPQARIALNNLERWVQTRPPAGVFGRVSQSSYFMDQGNRYRWDVENYVGHNLRR